MSQKMTAFSPSQHGFKFANSFETDIFWGPLHITTSGRCGGMSYTALDCYFYKEPIPTDSSLPPEGSVLNTYIFERQMKNLEGTGDQWADFLFNPFGVRTDELHNRGLLHGGEFQKLVQEIDGNRPCNLCLVAPSSDPSKSHQVVAFGYKAGTSARDIEIYIYDPNHPGMTCVLYPDASSSLYRYKNQSDNKPILNQSGNTVTWVAYFSDTDYIKRNPPSWTDAHAARYVNHNFSNQVVDHRDFRGDRLIGADFTNASINRVDFGEADATGARFTNAHCTASNFIGATLNNALFILLVQICGNADLTVSKQRWHFSIKLPLAELIFPAPH